MARKFYHYQSSPAKKKKWKIPPLLSVAVMVALLMAGLPYARGYIIRNYGIELKPKNEHAVANVQPFLQNDERWAQDKLGSSSYTMGKSGCLVCCIASAMISFGTDTDPGWLNRALYENGAYTKDGDLIWEKLKALGFSYSYQNDFVGTAIERLLDEGLLPVVKVKYKGNGVFHWVLVVGSSKDDFLVLDPLNASKEPMPLKTHGKAYAYRVLTKG